MGTFIDNSFGCWESQISEGLVGAQHEVSTQQPTASTLVLKAVGEHIGEGLRSYPCPTSVAQANHILCTPNEPLSWRPH